MRLYLINPCNSLVSIVQVKESRWNRYRVWKPLSLLVLAGLTPPEWEIRIVDENLGAPDYPSMARPDLVGITAFSSQANRAYEVAAHFRRVGVPVVMGGIHATMCLDEVMAHVYSVVTGEAEGIWTQVLEDARRGGLKRRYDGGLAEINDVPLARHDLLTTGYAFGAVQTTRGCPLSCNFCSVTAFNGAQYRQRPIPHVVQEFQSIRENRVLVVDDNLIGTRHDHIDRAKDLFRAMAQAKLRKKWIAQATINFADWKYYTLTFPVARYKHLSREGIFDEMIACDQSFYSLPRILRRVWGSLWQRRKPLISLVSNLSYRSNIRVERDAYATFKRQRGTEYD